jgi:toxin ParE1/3/4
VTANYHVIVLPEAKDDLFEIFEFVAKHDSFSAAAALLNRIEEKFFSLKENPERGHTVPELKRIYVEGFREIHYKPYRIIYQITGNKSYVYAVLDGRRELEDFLARRIYG